jgi:ABC-type tungstate transport system permease subunit
MNYTAAAAKAATAIQKAGTSMALRVASAGTFTPSTGSVSGSTTTDYTCSGVLKNVEYKWIDNTNILATDMMVLVGGSDLSVEPKAGDTWLIGTEEFTVVAWRPVRPGGTVILHKIVIRRA